MTQLDAARPDWAAIEHEALALLGEARERDVALRLIGSTGVRVHCARAAEAMQRLARPPKDIDFVCRSSQRDAVRRLLEERGYEIDRNLLVAMEGARFSFHSPATRIDVDVFVDRLEFCHTIDIRRRLEQHERTIPIEDLLLQKLQIVQLTSGDLADAGVVVATHDLTSGAADRELIDMDYVRALLSRDWGFHRTATANLETLESWLANGGVAGLGRELASLAQRRVARVRKLIEQAPKSRSWRMRARVGERMQWWQDVHEPRDTY